MTVRMYKAQGVAGGFENSGEVDDVETLLEWIGDAPRREGLIELRVGGRTSHFRVTRTTVAKDYRDG